jgi:hypothetical protein
MAALSVGIGQETMSMAAKRVSRISYVILIVVKTHDL